MHLMRVKYTRERRIICFLKYVFKSIAGRNSAGRSRCAAYEYCAEEFEENISHVYMP